MAATRDAEYVERGRICGGGGFISARATSSRSLETSPGVLLLRGGAGFRVASVIFSGHVRDMHEL